MRIRRAVTIGTTAILAAFLVATALPFLARRATDWLWYRELGLEPIFLAEVAAKWTVGLCTGVLAFAFLWLNVWMVKRRDRRKAVAAPRSWPAAARSAEDASVGLEIERGAGEADPSASLTVDPSPSASQAGGLAPVHDRTADHRHSTRPQASRSPTRRRAAHDAYTGPVAWISRLVNAAALPFASIAALCFGLIATRGWILFLQHRHRTPFGELDPVFGRDLAYYVFSLPVLTFGIQLGIALVVVGLVAFAAPLHIHRRQLTWPRWPRVHRRAAGHLGALIALLLAGLAAHVHFVNVPGLLYSTTGPLVGASYTDLHVRLPALHGLSLALVAGAGLVLWGGMRRRLNRALLLAGSLAGAAWLVGLVAAPRLYQRLVVLPNEAAREAPQIARHLAATRAAWGLDRVRVRDISAERPIGAADLAANAATIRNMNLWNRELLLQAFGQLQAIRTYYDFTAVAEDRYRVDGEYRQVHLAARELNTALLPLGGFINEHLRYTHGHGLAASPANQVTAEGLPVLFVKDIPPTSATASLRVERPEIYYGRLSNAFAFVRSGAGEAGGAGEDGARDVAPDAASAGGVPVSSFTRRLLFALRFRSLNVLLSREIDSDSRALYHRDVLGRAGKALPGLRLDGDPYLVIAEDGRLKWIVDAYTTSAHYPYAQPLADGTSSMRNSVKAVIDAYDGEVAAYLIDPADPLARTFNRAFPGVLRPADAMPADLRRHLRYPEDLFRAQTSLYGIFHMDDPEAFYHRENQWEIPAVPQHARADRYLQRMIMRLPGEATPEFVTMTPFTPRGRDNLAAWMVARSDGGAYGELAVYRFPRQSLVFGPRQVMQRISQDVEIARQVSLWDQRGSEAIWGDLTVIPIEESLLYVQPLYLRARGGRIPELKQVVLAHGSRAVMAETLAGALAGMFGLSGAVAAELADMPETRAAGELAAGRGAAPVGGEPVGAARASLPGATSSPASVPDPAESAAPGALPADSVAYLIRRAAEHYEAARAAQREERWAEYGEEMRRLGEVLERLRRGVGREP